MMNKNETPAETLARIQSGYSSNDELVLEAFEAAGFEDVEPRVTVLTYKAWKAKGRQVLRGEKALRVMVWAPVFSKAERDEAGRPKVVGMRQRAASLFHVSQTDPS